MCEVRECFVVWVCVRVWREGGCVWMMACGVCV